MKLQISNNAKKDKTTRTAMSQQALVNTLLSEKQATQPSQHVNSASAAPQPVAEWGK